MSVGLQAELSSQRLWNKVVDEGSFHDILLGFCE